MKKDSRSLTQAIEKVAERIIQEKEDEKSKSSPSEQKEKTVKTTDK